MIPEHFKLKSVNNTVLKKLEEKEIFFSGHKYKIVKVLRDLSHMAKIPENPAESRALSQSVTKENCP